MTTQGRPLRFLLYVGIMFAGALIWTVFIPGLIAWRGGVFYSEDIEKRLPPKARQSLDDNLRDQQLLIDSTRQAESRAIALIGSVASTEKTSIKPSEDALSSAKLLLDIHTHLETDLIHRTPPIVVAPFFLNPQLWLWPAIYFCLGIITFLLKPSASLFGATKSLSLPRTILLASTIYVLYEWPLWARNFIFGSHGRTLFAYTNFDIHPPSFVMQEAVIFVFCFLLARIWLQWFLLPLASLKRRSHTAVAKALDECTLNNLSEMLFCWQYTSVVLALGFGFFSNFFWRIVFQFHDQRYVISAISAHVLWATTWIAISLPLVLQWQNWESNRWQAIVEVERDASRSNDEKKRLTHGLKELRPGGFAALLGSAVIAAFSFVMPIIKELL